MSPLRLPPYRTAALILTVLLAATTAGCGSPASDSEGAPSGGASATEGWGLDPVQSVVDLIPEEIKKKGIVDNAVYNDAPPQMFLEENKLVGIQPDLAKAVSEVMGVEFNNIAVGSFDSIIPGLQGGRYDVAFSDFGVTQERMEVVDFIEQFSLGTGFAVKKGSGKDIAEAADLCGLTLGVLAGSYFIEQVQTLSDQCTASGDAAITTQTYPTASAAILAVTNGRTDAFSSSEDQLGFAAKQEGAQLDAQPFVYEPVPQAIAVPKGSPLAKPIQAAIAELISNGVYAEILNKWGIAGAALTDPSQVRINPTPES